MTSPTLMTFEGSAELVKLDARLPSAFFLMRKQPSGSGNSSRQTSATRTHGGPITKRLADFRTGAKGAEYSI